MKLIKSETPDRTVAIVAENVCAVDLSDLQVKVYLLGGFSLTINAPDKETIEFVYGNICRSIDKSWK